MQHIDFIKEEILNLFDYDLLSSSASQLEAGAKTSRQHCANTSGSLILLILLVAFFVIFIEFCINLIYFDYNVHQQLAK